MGALFSPFLFKLNDIHCLFCYFEYLKAKSILTYVFVGIFEKQKIDQEKRGKMSLNLNL